MTNPDPAAGGDEPPPELTEAIVESLLLAADGQRGHLLYRLAGIAAGWGEYGVFLAVCGWAGASMHHLAGRATPLERDDGVFYGLRVLEHTPGGFVERSVDEMPLDPAHRDAARLLTCYGNGDTATMMAIIRVHAERDGCAALMLSSVGIAAALGRAWRDAHPEAWT
jgi:hypothetical protein